MDPTEWISTKDLQEPPLRFTQRQIIDLMREIPTYNGAGDRVFLGSLCMDFSSESPQIVGGPPEMARSWPDLTPGQNAIIVDHLLKDVFFKRQDVERYQESLSKQRSTRKKTPTSRATKHQGPR